MNECCKKLLEEIAVKQRQHTKKYYDNNKEKCLLADKIWYENNKERVYALNRKWRKNNPEKYKKYQRSYRKRNKEIFNKSNNKHHKKYPERRLANLLVYSEIQKGNLLKPNKCSNCKLEKQVEGHHNDYKKPLEVIWLCHSCHMSIYHNRM